MPAAPITPIPDAEWDAFLNTKRVEAAYRCLIDPHLFWDPTDRTIYAMTSWCDAAVEGVQVARFGFAHEEGHKRDFPLSQHPTDAPGILQHAITVSPDGNPFHADVRAASEVLRYTAAPPELLAAADADIAAYRATLTTPPPVQTAATLNRANLAFIGLHVGVPLGAAIVTALLEAWQGGQLISLRAAETVALAAGIAFLAPRLHAILGPKVAAMLGV